MPSPYDIDALLGIPPARAAALQVGALGQSQDPLAGLQYGMPGQADQSLFNDDQSGILSSLKRNALSGIGYVGGSLDKLGARQVRGLLGGKPREALSIIPFSDMLGITDPADIVYSGDLMGTSDNEGFGWRALEFAGDVALDPMTYLSFGASAGAKGLKAFKAAGLVDEALDVGKAAGMGKRATRLNFSPADIIGAETKLSQAEKTSRMERAISGIEKKPFADIDPTIISQYMDTKFGGMAQAKVPFMDIQKTLGTGPRAQKAATAMDSAGDWVRESSGGRLWNQLFESEALGFGTGYGQRTARKAVKETARLETRAADIAYRMASTLKDAGLTDIDSSDLMRQFAEMGEVAFDAGSVSPAIREAAQPGIDEMAELLQAANEVGAPLEALRDSIGYWPRFFTDLVDSKGKAVVFKPKVKATVFDIKSSPSMNKRSETWKNLTGDDYMGTTTLKELISDETIEELIQAGGSPAETLTSVKEYIKRTYGNSVIRGTLPAGATAEMAQQAAKDINDISSEMAKTLVGLEPGMRVVGGYGNHAIADFLRSTKKGWRSVARTRTVMDAITNPEILKSAEEVGDVAGYVSVGEFLKNNGGKNLGIELGGIEGNRGYAYAMNKLGITDAGTAGMTGEALEEAVGQLGNFYLPKDIADDFGRYMEVSKQIGPVEKLLEFFDSFTSMFKSGVLTHPARFTRDAVSAAYNNIIIDGFSMKGYRDSKKMMNGIDIDVTDIPFIRDTLAARGIVPSNPNYAREALDEFKGTLVANEIIDPAQGLGSQVSANANLARSETQTLDDVLGMAPGNREQGIGSILKGAVPKTRAEAYPGNIRGVGEGWTGTGEKRIVSAFAPARAGEEMSQFVEGINRISPFLTLLRKGYDPASARLKVAMAQVDYKPSNFTDFERRIVTRLIPFYRFTRKQAPFQVGEIMEKPGGFLAQSMRGMNKLRDPDTILPEYLSQSLAVPIPGGDEGDQRFITGFGLPMEDVFGMIRPGPNLYQFAKGTTQELLGRLNPILKAPIELATGTQLFSGRNMEDLRGVLSDIIGNSGLVDSPPNTPILLEQLVSNSPASRILSSVRTAMDPRKGFAAKALQLGTGVRFADTNLERSSNMAIRNTLEDLLRQNPNIRRFSHLYAPDADALTAGDRELMDIYKIMGKESAKKARARKKAELLAEQAAEAVGAQ